MQSFITALVTYFACDGAASERMLNAHEAQECARSYEAVKVSFLSEEERRALLDGPSARTDVLLKGYRRFRNWMAQNPERVGELREAARVTRHDPAI